LGVPAGVQAKFFLGADASGVFVGEGYTTKSLLPGQSEVVSVLFEAANHVPPFQFYVVVDGSTAAAGMMECVEDNNDAHAGGVACPSVK